MEAESIGVPVDLSPDGAWLAVPIQRARRGSRQSDLTIGTRYDRTIQLHDLATRRTLRLDMAEVQRELPRWSPDSRRLAFRAGTDQQMRLWMWNRTKQRAVRVTDQPLAGPSGLWWLADNRRVLTVVEPAADAARARRRQAQARTGGAYPLDTTTSEATVAVYRHDPQQMSPAAVQDFSSNDAYLGDLVIVDVESGAVTRLLSDSRVVSFRPSPDGRAVSVVTFVGQARGSTYRNLFDLSVIDLATGTTRTIVKQVPQYGILMEASWSPDGRLLAYADSGPGTNEDLWLVSVEGSVPRCINVADRRSERHLTNRLYRAPLWSPDGRFFITIGTSALWRTDVASGMATRLMSLPRKTIVEIVAPTAGGRYGSPDAGRSLILLARDDETRRESFHRVDLTTGAATVVRDEAVRHGRTPFYKTDVSDNGRTLAFEVQSADRSEQMWISDTAFHSPRQVTHLNLELSVKPMGKSRLVSWQIADGRMLHGALLLPAGYQPGTRYPLVVYTYGDSSLSEEVNAFGIVKYTTIPYENMQLLATRGFAVLRPDTVTNVGTPMRDLAASVLPGVDAVIALGVADPNRIGIMGHSYGGYATLSLLVQTTRFKAAIVSSGVANLVSMYGQMRPDGTHMAMSWAEEDQGRMGGTLWEQQQRYIENSPIFYLDRVTTPVLIVHGDRDSTNAPHLADEIFMSLRRLNRRVDYVKYLGESHVILGWPNSVDYANRMIEWFERYLGPR